MKKLPPAITKNLDKVASLLKQGKIHEAFMVLLEGNKLDDNFKSSHEKNDNPNTRQKA